MKQVSLLGGADLAPTPKDLGDLPPVAYTRKGVALSPCGLYRYRLERRWGPGDVVTFCMLNPSVADSSKDDPTVKKCVGFARRWGCGSLVVVNLFAYRATDPDALDLAREGGRDVVGPENDAHLRRAFAEAALGGRIVAAWGAHETWGRAREVTLFGGPFEALRITKKGAPEHPLYVPYDVTPMPFGLP
ncbi:MAG TPA: DUF1643 domain-containing protein [Polyangiaceae bacterium]|nr:DUF1643 domain-containing protein [Polyangiaceae bacterium]